MFLSTYENKLDKKGRVSVPASFRSYLSNTGYNGIVCFPSFNNQSIEAWPQDRIEKISNAIDTLNPFEDKKDYFVTSGFPCLLVLEAISLIWDTTESYVFHHLIINQSRLGLKIELKKFQMQ